MEKYERNCPECGKIIEYKNKKVYIKQIIKMLYVISVLIKKTIVMYITK